MAVSKTVHLGSNPSAPAKQRTTQPGGFLIDSIQIGLETVKKERRTVLLQTGSAARDKRGAKRELSAGEAGKV